LVPLRRPCAPFSSFSDPKIRSSADPAALAVLLKMSVPPLRHATTDLPRHFRSPHDHLFQQLLLFWGSSFWNSNLDRAAERRFLARAANLHLACIDLACQGLDADGFSFVLLFRPAQRLRWLSCSCLFLVAKQAAAVPHHPAHRQTSSETQRCWTRARIVDIKQLIGINLSSPRGPSCELS
jgi:hypothetical protein